MSNKPAVKTEWDLSLIWDKPEELEAELEEAAKETDRLAQKWQHITPEVISDADTLADLLDDNEHWGSTTGIAGRAFYYYFLLHTLSQEDKEITAKLKKISDFADKEVVKLQFIGLRLARIPTEKQSELLQHPRLQKYKHYLERAWAESKYLLSEPEERILTLKSEVSSGNWVQMVQQLISARTAKIKIGKETKEYPFEQILTFCSDSRLAVRTQAGKAINKIVAEVAVVAEHEINSYLQNKKIDRDLRGLAKPQTLRFLADDMDEDVVAALVKGVSERFDLSQRFYRLKSKLLKQNQFVYHDRNQVWGDVSREIGFGEAVKIVGDSFTELDPEFAAIYEDFLANGKVDVYPRKGKGGGAFCIHDQPNFPVYILLNHTDKLRDVMTIAHEFGHAINDELMRGERHALDFSTPMSTAEVASTFCEEWVFEKLLNKVEGKEKLALLVGKLDDGIATVFRQIAAYNFESELHDKFVESSFLPTDKIGELFIHHMGAYLGDKVKMSPEHGNWWVYWSHFRSGFYVYSYASGQLIAQAMLAQVKKDHGFMTQVKKFLSAGRSAAPRELFAEMGIDIADPNFWKQGVENFATDLAASEALAAELGLI
jgi:oligoendopeptidase F